MARQGRDELITYRLEKGAKHRGQALGSCASGLPGESICRLGPCSGLPRALQQTGHAAPAASSLFLQGGEDLTLVLHSPNGSNPST